MTNPHHALADAIRAVTASMQAAIEDGYRSRVIDADDLAEVLLAIADRLDPPVPAEPGCEFCRLHDNRLPSPCPYCGQ